MRRYLPALLAITLGLVHAVSAEAKGVNMDLLGGLGARVSTLCPDPGRNLIYAAGSEFLWIFNTTVPGSPVLRSRLLLPGSASGVATLGNYAYLVSPYEGLLVVSTANPDNPALVGRCAVSEYAYDVAVAGNYAYVATTGGMTVVNISNPSSPSVTGGVSTLGNNGIGVSASFVYLANANGLVIVDISNPSSPSLRGTYALSGARDVMVSGAFAYIATASGLTVVNVSNPDSPQLAASYSGYNYDDSVLSGNRLCTVGSQGFNVFNADPANFPRITRIDGNTLAAQAVALAGNYAYSANNENGLVVTNLTNLSEFAQIGALDTGSANGLTLANGLGYVTDHYSPDLRIITTADPRNMTTVGSFNNTWTGYYSPRDIQVDGDYAYIAYSRLYNKGGLQIVDVSVPSTPVPAGAIANTTSATSVEVADNFAYVSCEYWGLMIYDVTDKNNPTLAGKFSTPGMEYVRNTIPVGNRAYVVGNYFRILDITNKANPVELSKKFYSSSSIDGLVVSGNYAYIEYTNSSADSGLLVIDIASNESDPSLVGTCVMGDRPRTLYLSGSYLYAALASGGLAVIDISVPTSPVLKMTYKAPTGGGAWDARAVGNQVFYADNDNGVSVLEITNLGERPTLAWNYRPWLQPSCVRQAGNYAYLGVGSGLVVADVSDPGDPVVAGGLPVGGGVSRLDLAGNTAYLAHDAGLAIVDVSTPALPSLIREVPLAAGASTVKVREGYAYVGDRSGFGTKYLRVIDVDPPAAAAEVGSVDNVVPAVDIAFNGHYAYVVGHEPANWGGLKVYDISDPAAPTITAQFGFDMSFFEPSSVAVTSTRAYVSDWNGVRIFQWSAPAHPTPVATFSINRGMLVTDGDRLFNSTSESVAVYSLASPDAPELAGYFSHLDYGSGNLDVSSNRIYAAHAGLRILAITPGALPTRTPTPTATSSATATQTVVISLRGKPTIAYPNPARDHITFAWDQPQSERVRIVESNAAGD